MNPLQNIKVVPLVQPQAIKDDAEFVGSKGSTPATCDTFGWNNCSVYVMYGASDIAMAEMEVWECSTSGGTYTLVTDAEYGGTGNATLPSATDDDKMYAFHIPLAARQRYLQIFLKAGNGSTGSFAAAFALLANPDTYPDSATERGLAAEIFVGA